MLNLRIKVKIMSVHITHFRKVKKIYAKKKLVGIFSQEEKGRIYFK